MRSCAPDDVVGHAVEEDLVLRRCRRWRRRRAGRGRGAAQPSPDSPGTSSHGSSFSREICAQLALFSRSGVNSLGHQPRPRKRALNVGVSEECEVQRRDLQRRAGAELRGDVDVFVERRAVHELHSFPVRVVQRTAGQFAQPVQVASRSTRPRVQLTASAATGLKFEVSSSPQQQRSWLPRTLIGFHRANQLDRLVGTGAVTHHVAQVGYARHAPEPRPGRPQASRFP